MTADCHFRPVCYKYDGHVTDFGWKKVSFATCGLERCITIAMSAFWRPDQNILWKGSRLSNYMCNIHFILYYLCSCSSTCMVYE